MSYINSKPSVGVECGIKKRGVSVQMTDRLLEDLLPTAWAYICPWGKHRSAEHGAICGPGTSPRSLRTTALGSKGATAFWGSACLLGAQHGTMLPATLGRLCQKLLLKDATQPDVRKVLCCASTQGEAVFLLQPRCDGASVPQNITFPSPESADLAN